MVKVRFNLRIERTYLERLDSIAKIKKLSISELIREMIQRQVNNGYPLELKIMAKNIVKSLREPFAYIRPLEETANKERFIRENLAVTLEEVFKLK